MVQEIKPDEIIIVNNNSSDRSTEIAGGYKGVKIISQKKPGIVPTRNLGFDSAAGDIIARCDADTIVPRDWIKNIKNDFAKNERIVAVSTSVATFDLPPFGEKLAFIFRIYMLLPTLIIGHFPLVGPSMAIRKSAWKKIRDELCTDQTKMHEDLDISFHIRKLGSVYHDSKIIALSSARRIKYNPLSFFGEYTIKFFRMLRYH